ncbi:MAG: PH domain-containing protein [Nocardioides sp.]|nr:PH domain-containing protein [Nocardioides sp.]
MPAGSEQHQLTLPHTWRPLGPRIMGWLLVVCLAVMCVVTWVGFSDHIKSTFSLFEKLTLAFIALIILACVHALTRSRVEAREDGLTVVNGYRRRDLEWAQVVAVNFPQGAPWPNLDLTDGTNISVHGIQASDGAIARQAVRDLRALLDRLG